MKNMHVDVFDGVKVSYPNDCGNAPKKLLLIKFYIALANGDDEFLDTHTSDNLSWNIIGDKLISDKKAALNRINKLREKGIEEIQILNGITHGNVCAMHGDIVFHDKTNFSFCDIFKFSGFGKNAKVKEVYSYIIET